MAHAENTVAIDRPIEEVFAYLADGTNNPHWRAGVLRIERTSTANGAGATYRQVLKGPGGRRIDGDYRVTGYQPPHLLEFAVTAGPARPTGRFALHAERPGTTRVTFSLDLTPRGFMRLMDPMVARTMRAEVQQLARLKQVLEQA
jgi:uncharacterized protein YndB with AHSA1/START domain